MQSNIHPAVAVVAVVLVLGLLSTFFWLRASNGGLTPNEAKQYTTPIELPSGATPASAPGR